jgi:hypothetical protein
MERGGVYCRTMNGMVVVEGKMGKGLTFPRMNVELIDASA